MRRVFLALVALLLLSMQHQVLVHPLAHIGYQVAHANDSGLASPVAVEACAECALLVAGGNVVADTPGHVVGDAQFAGDSRDGYVTRAADVPAWFRSRAPPSRLL